MSDTLKGLSERVLLVILDGYGINDNSPKNAIKAAKQPNLDRLFKDYPFTTITAGGELVGLPKGVMGNSEVGHMNLGAGRPVRQDLVRINEAMEQNRLKDLPLLKELIEKSRSGKKRIHLMGLLSDGGVHSHIEHIKAFLNILNKEDDLEIFFHAFMDGRDTVKTNGPSYIENLQKVEGFTFASMGGRSIGMDRDRRWEKIEHAYKVMIGEGAKTDLSPLEYMKEQYEQDIYDEFITPVLFDENAKIEDGDAIFFMNFRPDRAKQISLAFNDPSFTEFEVPVKPGYYLCMTPYIAEEVELPILFDKEKIKGTISEFLSEKGLKQFKIAETEKYAHVTYFFNGGEEKPFKGEEHFVVPSPKDVSTYDQKPEMSAPKVTEKLIEVINNPEYKFILVNYANCDMVGHTGNYEAAIKAVEAVDDCVGKLMEACSQADITMLLSADHGNSDQMTYEDGSPHTAHTKSPVPFSAFNPKLKGVKLEVASGDLALKDIASTVLNIMNIERPDSFTGQSIFN